MPLHVIESNRVRVLLAELDARLGTLDLFGPRTVLVPGRHWFSVVKNAIAGFRGACFQVELTTFEAWLARQAREADPGARLADPDGIAAACFQELVFSDRLGDLAFAPLRDYLRQGGDGIARDVAWQVSRQLGDLFLRYHLERPEIPAAWLAGRTFTGDPLEAWQAGLFSTILGEGDEASGLRLAAELLRRGRGLPGQDPLHALVPLRWPRRDREFLAGLAERRDVFLYLFSPCREFFEDVRRGRGGAQETGRTSDEPPMGDHPLLSAWGAPLSETVTFCHGAGGYQTVEGFVTPPGSSSLERLQREVLENHRGEPAGCDPSLRVERYASRRDEAVAIRDFVTSRLREDPCLRLCDFAVVVPEADAGPSAIDALEAVFAEDPAIPLHRVRRRSDSESLILETVERLFALPGEDGLAREVLSLALRPAIAGWTPEERTLVRRWVVETGVIRGWRDAGFAGLDVGLRTHSWERALQRLALGAMAAPGAALSIKVPGAGTLGVRPLDFTADQWPLLARLLVVIHGLRRFCEACGGRRTLAEWMTLLTGHLQALVTPLTERDGRLLGRCLEALRGYAADPAWRWRDPALSYQEVLPVVSTRVAQLRTVHSPWGERGVWVGSISDLGVLPFGHVWFAGLEDGAVAREVPPAALDVREVLELPGREPTPREAELTLFLAALCHVERVAVLSWCDRDPATGDPVAPATVVRELLEVVSPDRPSSQARPGAVPDLRSAREEEAAARLAAGGFDPSRPPADAPPALATFLRSHAPPGPPVSSVGRPARHRWRELAALWQFPLQAAARTWFFRRAEAPGEPPDEEPEALLNWLRDTWYERIAARELAAGTVVGDDGLAKRLEDDVEAFLALAASQAWGPVGVYEALVRSELASGLDRTVRAVLAAAAAVLPEPVERAGLARLHPGLDPAEVPDAIPPVRVGATLASPLPVSLSGTLPWFSERRGVLLLLENGRGVPTRRICEAWVSLCVLRLLHPRSLPDTIRVRLVRPFAGKAGDLTWSWPTPGPEDAAVALSDLSGELANPENLAFFPMELALEWLEGGHVDFGAWYARRAPGLVENWREDTRGAFRLEPVWDLDPLIDGPRAHDLARRLYLDPAAPVARQFLERIHPVLTALLGPPGGDDPDREGEEGDADG